MKPAQQAVSLALALALAGASARGGEKLTLRLRLEKGKTYTRWVQVDQRILQEIDNKEQTIEQRLGLGLSLEVADVAAEGRASVRVAITRVLVGEKFPASEFAYDSAQKEEENSPYARPYAALVGDAFTAVLTPLGRVESAEGLDALGLRVVRGAPGPGLRRRLAELAGQRLAPKRIEAHLGRLLSHLPERAVAPGDEWTRRVERGGGLPLAVETTYTLRSRAAGKTTLDVSTRTTPLPKAAALDLEIAALRPDLRGEGRGRMIVDEATGWVESASVKTTLSGSIRAAISAEESTSWPVLIESTLTIGPMPEE